MTGEFKGVSFMVTGGQGGSLKVSGGSGILRNGQNGVVAEGELKSVDDVMTIKGNEGASFVYGPSVTEFPADAYSKAAVAQFAEVELVNGDQWTLNDRNFLFMLEVPDLTRAQIMIALDKSLARASRIKLAKGAYTLWGYTITIEKPSGTVKFAHGNIIEAVDALVLGRPTASLITGASDSTPKAGAQASQPSTPPTLCSGNAFVPGEISIGGAVKTVETKAFTATPLQFFKSGEKVPARSVAGRRPC